MNFNGAQMHLLFNHIPVVAYPFLAAALVWAFVRREDSTYIFSCYAALVTGLATIAAYVTGDDGEHVLKQLPDFPRDLIHVHERTAYYVLLLSIAISLAALASLPLTRKYVGALNRRQGAIRKIFLILCLVVSGLLALTAHQGGVIRHTEIRE